MVGVEAAKIAGDALSLGTVTPERERARRK